MNSGFYEKGMIRKTGFMKKAIRYKTDEANQC